MEYQLVIVSSVKVLRTDFEQAAQELAGRVNEQIAEGWRPQGGPTVGRTQSINEPHLMQAMVKDS